MTSLELRKVIYLLIIPYKVVDALVATLGDLMPAADAYDEPPTNDYNLNLDEDAPTAHLVLHKDALAPLALYKDPPATPPLPAESLDAARGKNNLPSSPIANRRSARPRKPSAKL